MNQKFLIKVGDHIEANKIQDDILEVTKWEDIGFVSYNLPLVSTLSAIENIMLPINYHKRINMSGADSLVQELLEKFGIQNIAHYRQKSLNEHQLLIVKFLRAIIAYPSIVVFVLPHNMISVEIYDMFTDFIDSISNFDIVIIEHESFVNTFYKELNYTEISYEQWATHVLNI